MAALQTKHHVREVFARLFLPHISVSLPNIIRFICFQGGFLIHVYNLYFIYWDNLKMYFTHFECLLIKEALVFRHVKILERVYNNDIEKNRNVYRTFYTPL